MADNTSQVKQAEAILHAQDYLQILRTRWKEALFVFLLVFVSCAVITKLSTPMYTSSMRIEIKPPGETIDITAGGGAESPVRSHAAGTEYMTTQFEVLVSQRNLMEVAKKLNLPKQWGTSPEGAAGSLAGMIKVMPVRGTNMVDIIVSCSNASTACEICNQVTQTYREIRDRQENQQIQDAISERQEVFTRSADDLDNKAEAVRYIISTGKYLIGMWNGGSGSVSSSGAEEQKYRDLQSAQTQLINELERMRVHVGQLKGLKDEDLLEYVVNSELLSAESYASSRVRTLNETYHQEEDERAQKLMAGYGEHHPIVLRLDEKHNSTKQDLYKGLVDMRDAMEKQLVAKEKELENLGVRIKEAHEALRGLKLEEREIIQAQEDYMNAKRTHDQLYSKLLQDKMRLNAHRSIVEVYSMPSVAGVPTSPNIKLNLIVGAVVGLIAGVVVAVVYNFFDTSVKSLEDAERHLSLPVLGVIPQDAGLLVLQGGNSPDAEAYRILRTNIELKKALYKARTFAVVSANAGEGKTTTLSNLAYVYAAAGYSTLMIDADLRRPRLARYAEIDGEVGLSNYLTNNELELKDVVFRTKVPNLYLMPSGSQPSDPSGVLGSYRMDQLLAEVSKRFDVVFFDSPPVLGVSDASLLVSKVDATLVVLQPRKMPLKALLRTKSIIQNVGGQIMGLVMNNVDISADTQYQYYTTYYSYYTNDKQRQEPNVGAPRPAEPLASAPVDAPAASQHRRESSPASESDADLY